MQSPSRRIVFWGRNTPHIKVRGLFMIAAQDLDDAALAEGTELVVSLHCNLSCKDGRYDITETTHFARPENFRYVLKEGSRGQALWHLMRLYVPSLENLSQYGHFEPYLLDLGFEKDLPPTTKDQKWGYIADYRGWQMYLGDPYVEMHRRVSKISLSPPGSNEWWTTIPRAQPFDLRASYWVDRVVDNCRLIDNKGQIDLFERKQPIVDPALPMNYFLF